MMSRLVYFLIIYVISILIVCHFLCYGITSVAVFLTWARQCAAEDHQIKNPTMLGCIAASALLRHAASLAFENKKRSTVTGDIIEYLGIRLFSPQTT